MKVRECKRESESKIVKEKACQLLVMVAVMVAMHEREGEGEEEKGGEKERAK